ncbi:flavin reductase family protein [Aquabacter sp. CN5-332]|uniref:flavin reductase family protein n=1 Tax=Aquabacter sp. CN5-332 TaxID=3156608 RepID=UPI0032B3D072
MTFHVSPHPAVDDRQASLPLIYRAAMRKLAGAVSILTVGEGESRTGLTATSVSSLSVDPPVLIICVNRDASARAEIERRNAFAINLLRPEHQEIADRFAGRGGIKGAARYQGAQWTTLETGAPVLSDALAVFDCAIDDLIERHSHTIILGRVVAARVTEGAEPLLYWAGSYARLTRGAAE